MKILRMLLTSVASLLVFGASCAANGQERDSRPTRTTQEQNSENHQIFTSSMYGVKFTYPYSYSFETERNITTNFTNGEGAVVLGTAEIPDSLYSGTNFEGGKFAVSVGPNIRNSAACKQFASGKPDDTVSINGIPYSVSKRLGAATGHYSDVVIFHAYQHGFCYEFMLEISTYRRANLEDPSSVQEFPDGKKIQIRLLSGISYFQPRAKPPSATRGTPAILSFTASSAVAGAGVRSGINFSWTTQDVDYVQLQYSCPNGVVILEDGTARCERHSYSSPPPNHSPNASTRVVFGNTILASPEPAAIPVTVTLVPFANGVDYSNLSKALIVTVDPYNPFPKGVPTSNSNMSVTVSPASDGKFSFAHGSTVSIEWVDTNTAPHDPCVNLYLVQDNEGGGETYIYKLSEHCVEPGSGGSYRWAIPNNFFGSGFRILGAAPGGRAHALSTPFTILLSR
jgi:hypothetical protein